MSIWPAVMAERTTLVSPSWILSVTGTLLAFKTCRMILPITPPSVSILDETTTWACAVVAVNASTARVARSFVERRMMHSTVLSWPCCQADGGDYRVLGRAPASERLLNRAQREKVIQLRDGRL